MNELQRTKTSPFMAKPNDSTPDVEPETPWGTCEELLLACAVNRYGTENWDSVAIEVQKRSSASALNHLFTSSNCKQKYDDLKRRYAGDVADDDDDKAETTTTTIPWLDELRKLRVAELKRELERYDLSIVSLQLKVKRLKEEREPSLNESEKGGEKSDLEKSLEREREGEERERDAEPEKSSPESDRDSQSVNASNSTDPKCENLEACKEPANKEPEPDQTGDEGSDRLAGTTKPVQEDSCNGSSDSIEKGTAREPVKVEPEIRANDSPELLESVAESKGGGEEGAKENSDVQSSASLARKKGRDKVGAGACSSGEEPGNEDQSHTAKGIATKSPPLVDFLEIVRSHKLGSVFERRLESQETPIYRNLIRQHIDLETVRTRLEEGLYLGCTRKFFRDLLLLCNNAIVFFDKKSSESTAAIELQRLVSKEIAQRNPKSESSVEEQTLLPPAPVLPKKPDSEPSDSLLLKPKISGSMIVCRKRSSIAVKPFRSSSGTDRKSEKTESLAEDKPILNWKQPEKTSGNVEDNQITKKRSRDRFTSGTGSLKKNDKNLEAISSQNQGKRGSSGDHSEPKNEKKKSTTVEGVNKRSAANFLNRMKRSSSSNNGPLLDTLKSSGMSSDNYKEKPEQKKSGNGKGEGRKEQVSRSLGGRKVKEQESPAKRSVGRPPKRAAAPPPLHPPVSGKRSREGGEKDVASSRQKKKRSRK